MGRQPAAQCPAEQFARTAEDGVQAVAHALQGVAHDHQAAVEAEQAADDPEVLDRQGCGSTAAGLRYVVYLFVTDLADPWKVIAEPSGFLIAPREWERVGDVSNVVFTNGAIARDNGEVYIYYAASDTRLHVASTTVERLLDFAFHTPADPLRSRDCVAQRCALIDKNRAYLASIGD